MVFVQKWFPVGKVFNFYYNVFSHTMKDFSAILLLELANFNAVFHVKHYRTCYALCFVGKVFNFYYNVFSHTMKDFSAILLLELANFNAVFHVKHYRTCYALCFA